jgi:hypothetical protein
VLLAVPVSRASWASVDGPWRSNTSSTSRTAEIPGDAAREVDVGSAAGRAG